MEFLSDWIGYVAVACLFVSLIGVRYFAIKDRNRLHVNTGKMSLEDAMEARRMLVGFLYGCLEGTERKHHECMEAGCDGNAILADSSEITAAVMLAHAVGGRLVLRKVDERDIETTENTRMEVQVKLSDMDICRAKQLEGKNRG